MGQLIGFGIRKSGYSVKNQNNAALWALLFFVSVFGWTQSACGQGVFSLSSGLGFPELAHVGIGYQLKNMQFDFTVGAFPQANVSLLATSVGAQLHLGKSWRLLRQKSGGGGIYRSKGKGFNAQHPPWFVKTGFIYYREESELLIDKYYYLNLRFGREIGISRNIGMNITLGGVLKLLNSEVKKQPVRNLELEFPVLPAGGISLFYLIR